MAAGLNINVLYSKFKELDPRNYGLLSIEKVNKLSQDLNLTSQTVARDTKFSTGHLTFSEIYLLVADQIYGWDKPALPASLNILFLAFRKADTADSGQVPFDAFTKEVSHFSKLEPSTDKTSLSLQDSLTKISGPQQQYKLNTFKDGIRRFGKDGNGTLSGDEVRQLFRYLDLPLDDSKVDKSAHYGMQELLDFVITDKDHPIYQKGVNMNNVYQAFDWCDVDHNGVLDSGELAKALRLAGQNPSQEEFRQLQKHYDINHNGLFDFDEFVGVVCDKHMNADDMKKKALEAFAVFDKDGSGYITLDELRRVLTTYGEDMSNEEVDKLFASLDANKDGKLNIDEFVGILLK